MTDVLKKFVTDRIIYLYHEQALAFGRDDAHRYELLEALIDEYEAMQVVLDRL